MIDIWADPSKTNCHTHIEVDFSIRRASGVDRKHPVGNPKTEDRLRLSVIADIAQARGAAARRQPDIESQFVFRMDLPISFVPAKICHDSQSDLSRDLVCDSAGGQRCRIVQQWGSGNAECSRA